MTRPARTRHLPQHRQRPQLAWLSRLSRRTVTSVGIAALLAGGVVGAGSAAAANASPSTNSGVSADDSRATVVQGNINACPAGESTLVTGGTATTTQNGVTVTVTHLASAQPNPYPAGGWTTLPAGTPVLIVTLPSGDVLTGDIDVKGADGYNDYPGSALTSLIPPVSNGDQIAGLSHFFVCGALTQPPGSIAVTKHVVGSGTGSAGPFAVTVDCGSGHVSDLSLTAGVTRTVNDIPAGSSCTVTETDSSQASSTAYSVDGGTAGPSAPTFTVGAGQDRAVSITNTYDPAKLIVSKHVSGTPPSGVTSYPVTVDCDGTVTDISLGDGDSHSFDGVGGTHCSVTETDSKGAAATYSVDSGTASSSAPSVTLVNGTTTHVDITNTFTATPPSTGSVKVTKEVTGTPPADLGSFDMSLDCDGAVTPISVAAGDSQTVTGIADGANCALTEPDNKGATSTTFAVNGGDPQPTATFSVAGDEETDVLVDNDYQPAGTPALTITKSVDKTSAQYGDDLTYRLHVVSSGSATEHAVTVTDTVPLHTTYVSSTCDTPCQSKGLSGRGVTWAVGDLAAGSGATLTLVVHITKPASHNGHLPIETIPNVALAASNETPHVPSNRVVTHITAVLAQHHVRHHHGTRSTHHATHASGTQVSATHATRPASQSAPLPFTGAPSQQLALIAVGLLLVGGLLLGFGLRGRRH